MIPLLTLNPLVQMAEKDFCSVMRLVDWPDLFSDALIPSRLECAVELSC
jgi:hypothetical protein